jgi:nucleoside-triphosphatase THEP1
VHGGVVHAEHRVLQSLVGFQVFDLHTVAAGLLAIDAE